MMIWVWKVDLTAEIKISENVLSLLGALYNKPYPHPASCSTASDSKRKKNNMQMRLLVTVHCRVCRTHTLHRLCIVADLICYSWTRWMIFTPVITTIKLVNELPPGWCWIRGKPPVHQHPLVILRWIVSFYFIAFWVWHIQALTQKAPVHIFHRICHCLWCQWSSCSQGEQNNTVHGRTDVVAVLLLFSDLNRAPGCVFGVWEWDWSLFHKTLLGIN